MSRRNMALVLALAGLAISAYLTAVDLWRGTVPLACATEGIVNCDAVTTSAQSRLGPVPVAILGLVWFLGLLGLLAAEGRRLPAEPVRAELVWTAGGLAMVFYLVYAELFEIGAICLWCTAVHAIVVAVFLLTLMRLEREQELVEEVG